MHHTDERLALRLFIRRLIDETDDNYDVNTEFGEDGPYNVPSLPGWILDLREDGEKLLAEIERRNVA